MAKTLIFKKNEELKKRRESRKFTSAAKAHTHFVVLVQSLSHVLLFVTPWAVAHTRPLCPPLSPRVCANACPLSW